MKIELNQKTIDELAKETIEPCVTIYMPLSKTLRQKSGDKVMLENLLKIAAKKITAGSGNQNYVRKILEPARILAQDHFFWKTNAAGLAFFIAAPKIIRHLELPLAPKQSVYVGKGFDTARALRIMEKCREFFVLATNKNNLTLWAANCGSINKIEIRGFPKHTKDFLPGRDPEKNLQSHGRAPIGKSEIFHGHGKGKDTEKELLLKYFKMADKIIYRYLAKKTAPLVFAGVDEIFSIYRRANNYPHLFKDNLKGNFENETPENILKKSARLLKNAAQ